MRKLMLIAALVCGAFFVNSCDKDDSGGSSGKDPVANLADYLDKPYSLLVSDCEKAGYIRTITAGGSGPAYGYAKSGYSITAIADAQKNSVAIMNVGAAEIQTAQQLADYLRRAYTSLTGRYGDSEMAFSTYDSDQGSKDYNTIDELCAAIAAVSLEIYDYNNIHISFMGKNKGQDFFLEYRYGYDKDTSFGVVMEIYYSPSAV